MGWTEHEEIRLIHFANEGLLFYSEIAKRMGKREGMVRHKARALGLPGCPCPERMGGWNAIHSHLREDVMKFYLTNSWSETAEKFKLSERELKSLFTAAYRDKNLAHLRKDRRNHKPWTAKQLRFLLQHAGIMPRKWIAQKIGRGNETCIKERMHSLGICSRSLQGITLSQFRKAFGKEPGFYIKTQAGPDGGIKSSLPTRWKIVPWTWLDEEIKAKRLKAPNIFRQLVSTQAVFQNWVFEGKPIERLKMISRKRMGTV